MKVTGIQWWREALARAEAAGDEVVAVRIDWVRRFIALYDAAGVVRRTIFPRLMHGSEAHKEWLQGAINNIYRHHDAVAVEFEMLTDEEQIDV